MNYPKGRECRERECRLLEHWPHKSKCGADETFWPTCPRALRAQLTALRKAGNALAEMLADLARGTGIEKDVTTALSAWRDAAGKEQP